MATERSFHDEYSRPPARPMHLPLSTMSDGAGSVRPVRPVQLLYLGPTDGEWGSVVWLTAQLANDSGVPLAGREVRFHFAAREDVATTDAWGMARAQMAATQPPGNVTVTVSYDGDAEYASALATAVFALRRVSTRMVVSAAATLPIGVPQQVHATLTNIDGAPLADRTISFHTDDGVHAAITDSAGTASIITKSVMVAAVFAGDEGHELADAKAATLRYSPTGFVVWGGNPSGLAIGAHINFWGPSWAAQVTGGDYAAARELKGWAESSCFALCQPTAHTQGTPKLTPGCWSSRGGWTSPPSNLTEYIGVLVTDAVTKSQGKIYGNVAALAMLRVDEASRRLCPGTPAYGTLVAIVQGGALFAEPPELAATSTQPAAVAPGQAFEVVVELSNPSRSPAEGVVVQSVFTGGTTPHDAEAAAGRLAPGERRSVAIAQSAPAVEARQDSESTPAYEQRIAAQDGRPLITAAEVQFTDAYGRVVSPVPLYSTGRLVLPRLLLSISAPFQVMPADSMNYVVVIHNAGSAATTSGSASVVLPDGGTVELGIGALEPGATFQAEVPWTIPALPARAPGESAADYTARLQAIDGQLLTASVALTWRDGQISVYGPVSQRVNSTLQMQVPPVSELPPDPTEVAPPLPRTSIAPFADSVSFLYTGSRPIQTDVDPGALEPRRLAVLRGKVSTRDGMPLSGVAITILGHPEYGRTLTREDGMFDLAVNGGGQITVQYTKAGYLASQRQVVAPWRDHVWLPDVVLIAPDAKATLVDLSGTSTEVQIAQGSPVADADGTRTAMLLFSPDTRATMTLPDGSTQALPAITVRATEYTVGEAGPSCMPGTLPPTSGYTYAVELSVDEASSAGAAAVRFSQPVAFYVENFLAFPAGMHVPVGSYDVLDGTWKAEHNGRVIAILAIADGMAQLDTGGDGRPDDEAALAALGITAAERRALAGLYAPGTSLWRVRIPHFSTWDHNWGVGPPGDARPPDLRVASNQTERKPDIRCGCIIEVQNQTLGETLPITGVPFLLHYSSDRAADQKIGRTVRIPLSDATLPASVKSIVVEFTVAGRRFSFVRPAVPDQVLDFTWDGKDAYGRTVQGEVIMVGRTGYKYGLVYLPPRDIERAFALLSATPNTLSPARDSATLWQPWTVWLGGWIEAPEQLGGWSPGIHHAYNPLSEVLYPGTGGRRSATRIGPVISTIAGPDSIATATDVAVGPEGNVYIVDGTRCRVHCLKPDGTMSVFAGTGRQGNDGDGGPAIEASLQFPEAVAVGPDGSVYVSDTFNFRVRRIRPDGIISACAGTGVSGYGGDGGPADQAQLIRPIGLAVGPDGSVYIADAGSNHVRRVASDGTISTFVGSGGRRDSTGDGGPAVHATFLALRGLAVGPDGSVYIVDHGAHRIRRVGPDGLISAFAGRQDGMPGFEGDGGPAVNARFNDVQRVAVGPDGSIYIADLSNHRIRRVGLDGLISTFAGTGQFAFGGDGGPALQARFKSCPSVAVGPNGSVYVCDGSQRVRRIDTALTGTGAFADEPLIPSEDGAEIYIFDGQGRHLRTVGALTRTVRHEFTYDASGRLSSIQDGHGLVTRVERDASGSPVAIVAPHGQRTALTVDDHGYLASITDPAGERMSLTYTPDGLLTSITDAGGELDIHEYGPLGQFTKDLGPGCGSKQLSRVEDGGGYTVSVATALGRTTTYRVQNLPGDKQLRTNTSPAGLQTSILMSPDGNTVVTAPDGTVTTTTEGPDVRFGMHAPQVTARTIRLPSGLTRSATHVQSSTLANGSHNKLDIATLTSSVTLNGNTSTTVYTASTRELTSTNPRGRVVATTLDEEGRVAKVVAPSVLPREYQYNSEGQLQAAKQGGRTLSFTYDAQGYLATLTDGLSDTTRFEHDAAGRIIRMTLPGERSVDLGYHTGGQPASLAPPGRPAHRFSYLPDGSLERYTPPPVAPDAAVLPTTYSYDMDMRLAAIHLPDGNAVAITRDGAGRIDAITTPRTTVRHSYDPQGRLERLLDAAGASLAFQYDGALVKTVEWMGGVQGSVGTTYTPDFRPASIAVNGQAIPYEYERGLLRSAGALVLERLVKEDALAGTRLGNIATTQTYDDLGALKTFAASVQGHPLYSLILGRDDRGRIVRKTETALGVTKVWDYGFDAAGRLQTAVLDGAPHASYAYDANGNRTSVTRGGVTQSATYDDQDRLVADGSATYTFGPNGDLQKLQRAGETAVTEFTYDAALALTSVHLPDGTRVEYVIDALGRRVGKSVNGAPVRGFLYDGSLRVIAELDAQGQIAARFVYGTRAHVPDYMVKGDATYRIVTDHLGSVRLIINAQDGSIAQALEYGPWGEVLVDTSPGFQPFGFAGGLHDGQTGFTRFGARDYDAETGRWITKDPIRFGGGTNLYMYAGTNPAGRIDPSGLADFSWLPPASGGLSNATSVPVVVVDMGNNLAVTLDPGEHASLFCADWDFVMDPRSGAIFKLGAHDAEILDDGGLARSIYDPRPMFDPYPSREATPVEREGVQNIINKYPLIPYKSMDCPGFWPRVLRQFQWQMNIDLASYNGVPVYWL